MEDKIKYYLPQGLLIVCMLIGLFHSSMMALVSVVVCGVYSMFVHWVEKHSKIQDIKSVVDKQNEVIHKLAEELATLRTSVTGLKLTQGISSSAFNKQKMG